MSCVGLEMFRVWSLLLAGCAGSHTITSPAVPPLDDVEVRIDAVDIGCREATCAPPTARLSLRSGTEPAKVRMTSVTIAGRERTLRLAAHAPTVWTSAGRYEPWNEHIGSDEVMAIEYGLVRVDWDHFDREEHVEASSIVVEVDGRERVFAAPRSFEHLIVD